MTLIGTAGQALATVAAAVAFAAAIPPVGVWPLTLAAPGLALWAIDCDRRWRRFGLGLLFGSVHMALTQHWIGHAMQNLGGLPSWAAVLVLLGHALVSGLPWALIGVLSRPVRAVSGPALAPLALSVLWVAAERHVPVLFPYTAASPLHAVAWLLWPASLGGIPVASFVVVLCSLLTADAIIHRREPQRIRLGALATLVVVWLGVGLLLRHDVTLPPDGVRVLLVQPAVTVAEKTTSDPQRRMAAHFRAETLTLTAIESGPRPDAVVWPEGSLAFPYVAGSGTLGAEVSRRADRFARGLGLPLLAGTLRVADSGAIRNALLDYRPLAAAPVVYDKQRLVPFGERVPLADTFPSLATLVSGMSHYEPGTGTPRPVSLGHLVALPTICYEAIDGAFVREGLLATNASVILNVTNDVWFGDWAEPEQHFMLQKERAIENGVWLVRATNTGVTALVAPNGQVVARTDVGAMTTLRITLPREPSPSTFYRRHGALLSWLGLAALLAALAWRHRARWSLAR